MSAAQITPFAEKRMSLDARDQFAQTRGLIIVVPPELHPDSKQLVQLFAEELARKLRSAEGKYGYADGWLHQDWEAECREHLVQHLKKGDPRDVAIYCAFMWAHGWRIDEPSELADRDAQMLGEDA
jgi:hypothetical protein